MSSSLRRDGVSVSWRTILDNSPQSSFLYQNTYTGYMPALNLKTKDGRVGIGTYETYLALTYFLDTNTTNGANTQLNLLSNGTATIGGKPIVCVTKWASGTSWYRKYSDGWIEQGGQIGRQVTVTTNFNIAFTQIPTCICGCVYNRASTFYAREVYPNTVSTTAFTITNSIPAGSTSDYIKWYACGY